MPLSGAPAIKEILEKTVVLSSAELVAFVGGAIDIVEAPGAGKMIWPIDALLSYKVGTFDFTGSPTSNFAYDASGFTMLSGDFLSLVGFGVPSVFFAVLDMQSPSIQFTSLMANKAFQLQLKTGTYAGVGIHTAGITAPGLGYANGDTGTVTTGNGDATYLITGVGALGVVTSFVITFPGTGYTVGAGQATATGGIQPGAGAGLTINVTAVGTGNGSIKVVTHYTIIDVP